LIYFLNVLLNLIYIKFVYFKKYKIVDEFNDSNYERLQTEGTYRSETENNTSIINIPNQIFNSNKPITNENATKNLITENNNYQKTTNNINLNPENTVIQTNNVNLNNINFNNALNLNNHYNENKTIGNDARSKEKTFLSSNNNNNYNSNITRNNNKENPDYKTNINLPSTNNNNNIMNTQIILNVNNNINPNLIANNPQQFINTVSNNLGNLNINSTNNINYNNNQNNKNNLTNFSNLNNITIQNTNQINNISPNNASNNTNNNFSLNNAIKPKQELNKIYLPNNYNIANKSNSPEGRSQISGILKNQTQNSNSKQQTNIPIINTNINSNLKGAANINITNNQQNNTVNTHIPNNNYYSVTNTQVYGNINSTTNVSNYDSKKTTTQNINTTVGKGLNIIPLRNLTNHREQSPGNYNNTGNNNEKSHIDRLSPKPKDVRIPNTNISPKNLYGMPSSTKNVNDKINFENKFGNRIYTNLNNISNKSPSPKHMDFITRLTKKSPDTKK